MQQPPTIFRIAIFWLPLMLTWLMMAFEGPYLSALIARMTEPKYNLAAYGVAYSFALIIEAPVIMMMTASTALVKDRLSYYKLRNFCNAANILLTILILICVIPGIFKFIAQDLVGLNDKVAQLTYFGCLLIIPWPGAIGYRRFYQGILIREQQTRLVAIGTVFRLVFMSLTALFFFKKSVLPGAAVGCLALSAGVVAEAIYARIAAHKCIKKILTRDQEADPAGLKYNAIFSFYYPLALTSLIGLGVHPLVTFFVGQSRFPLESLAVLPVVNSIVFIFRSVGLSFQEVGVTFYQDQGQSAENLRRFALLLGVGAVLGLALIGFTPVGKFWLRNIAGLDEHLASFAFLPLQILTIIPGLSVLLSYQRSVLVVRRKTKPITTATTLEVLSIICSLYILIHYFSFIGATAAACAFVLGRLGANGYLFYKKNAGLSKI